LGGGVLRTVAAERVRVRVRVSRRGRRREGSTVFSLPGYKEKQASTRLSTRHATSVRHEEM
jgi:hypothetical protein